VAGGFGGTGAPLHARTRVGSAAGSATGSAAASGPETVAPPGPASDRHPPEPQVRPGCPARHCWVTAPVDGGVPRPGLLLEWRRGERGWEGRVAYAAELRTDRWGAVEEWLPAEVVTSVGRGPQPGGT
jgi:hypothetical protein